MLTRSYIGAWRPDLPQLDFTLAGLTPLLNNLLHQGGSGLVWPRIRHNAAEYGAVGEILEHTYQQYADALQKIEVEIALITSMMAEAGIEAVLVKGWALSSLYAPPQVRRPGDIDLIVPTGRLEEAQAIVAEAYKAGLGNGVDLYSDDTWRSIPFPDYRERLVFRDCGGTKVATLGPTDALRQVSLHYIRHLRNRVPNTTPYWLCDIGALVEHGGEIDWDRLFAGDKVQANQVRLALAMSRDIVGTDASMLPGELADFHLDPWVHDSVYQLWNDPHRVLNQEIRQHGVPRALTKRLWPNPLNAALRSDVATFTGSPRRYQAQTFARMVGLYGARVLTGGKLVR